MQTFPLRAALVLGLLCAVGPLAIDMYLPALPHIGDSLGAGVGEVQLTLSLYFAAFGVAQLVYGPLADQTGRKPPLFLGLSIFALASIGCAMAPGIGWLIVFRFLQGLGAAAVMVIPRAIVRDMFTGPQATRRMATSMLVISVAPLMAPLQVSTLSEIEHPASAEVRDVPDSSRAASGTAQKCPRTEADGRTDKRMGITGAPGLAKLRPYGLRKTGGPHGHPKRGHNRTVLRSPACAEAGRCDFL